MMDTFQLHGEVRGQQTMVTMRDGVQLNTFVYLPRNAGPSYPVIVQRTPYGIAAADCDDPLDWKRGWLPAKDQPLRGSLLRGWQAITERGYALVYQDTRGRFGSEGEDLVYAKDAEDGHDLLIWITQQPWSNQRVGLSGSSAGATTALAAASVGHPSVRAFFAQAGASSIYDDVVYEGQSIEMERLWLWVAKNIPGLSKTHRDAAAAKAGVSQQALAQAATSANQRYQRLDAARHTSPPFLSSADWLRLPLLDYPDFALWQPWLNEILSHPLPDEFRARHNFRNTIDVPGFHVTTWYDIFQTSVISAYMELQERVGNQRLWIGPNDHYFVYEDAFWTRDPYFEWFDHWLKGKHSAIVDELPVRYSPRAWINDRAHYQADDWREDSSWPPRASQTRQFSLCATGQIHAIAEAAELADQARSWRYDPRHPIPTIGGRNMLIEPGALDQQTLQDLPDYGLCYRGETLRTALQIAGPVNMDLHIESDCPDTDLVVKLIEEKPDGAAILLLDGVSRVMLREPARGAQPLASGEIVAVHIELGHLCHTLTEGNRLRVDVSSSNFPRRARNTNSGHLHLAADSEADIRIAHNTLHHGAQTPTSLTLTVLEPT